MENSIKRKKFLSVTASLIVIAAGAVLLAVSLRMLPGEPAFGFPWEFLGAVVSFIVIAAGGGWLGSLLHNADREDRGFNRQGLILVFYIIIAGVVLMCFNFGALPEVWRRVFFSWQMLLMLLGVIGFTRRHFTGGGILFAVGAFFLLRPLASIYPAIDAGGNIGAMYWPALLIAAGIVLLGGMLCRRGGGFGAGCGGRKKDLTRFGAPRGSGTVDINVVFGSGEQIVLDPVFRGGRIRSVFGGVLLDLRRTELPEGETYIRVESVFGGTEILAPEGWSIELRNESVFGGFADKRLRADKKTYDDGRRLIIRASNVFGGGEIK